jgi:hypothetical protein
MSEKIFPRNLTARADRQVVGNPVTTRLESGVGNCYPGLEFDQRNLDRRFFPGLVFEFISESDNSNPDVMRGGARLLRSELRDPDLNQANNPVLSEVAQQRLFRETQVTPYLMGVQPVFGILMPWNNRGIKFPCLK